MPWRERSRMSERSEFVQFARGEGQSISELCRRFGISRKTGYKWLRRAGEGLEDRSRRPRHSPDRTLPALEAQVCALRGQHPAWGGRKLHRVLRDDGEPQPPAPSTITGILARGGLLHPDRRLARDWERFEYDAPNQLWQMDFKGHFPAGAGRCHPLTVLDDHSRFNISLQACADERAQTVHTHLTAAFQRYGLPERMLMDNGSPWGSDQAHPYTGFTAWLIRLGISVLHGRPYHPQTQGKDERFHRTLQAEVLASRPGWHGLDQLQQAFDHWRGVYNGRRPHESLALDTPASRYQPSPRPLPDQLPAIDYAPGDEVRRVQDHGRIAFRGHVYRVGRAFVGQPVALRAAADGVWDVYFCHQRVAEVDLRQPLLAAEEV